MSLQTGQRVLRGNFTLRRQISENAVFQLWEADPGSGDDVLIKAWPFLQDEPTTVERNLWDHELRTLYRLASTPEAERHLVRLMDAAVDRQCSAFVIAQRVPGFDRLSEVLKERRRYGFLADIGNVGKRADLWSGALRLVQGLAHVHRYRTVHRAVTAENIFLDASQGPSSMRLGGFEWTVRLGEPLEAGTLGATPLGRINASLNGDWRSLGILLARLFGASLEEDQIGDIRAAIAAVRDLQHPGEDEKDFLRTLLEANGHGPVHSRDLVQACRKVVETLRGKESLKPRDRLGVVVALRDATGPTELARSIARFDSSVSATDEEALRRWIQLDLAEAAIVATGHPQHPSYFLRGRGMPYTLGPFEHKRDDTTDLTWNLGFIRKALYLNEAEGNVRDFPAPGMIQVYTVRAAYEDYADICKRTRPWTGILPTPLRSDEEPDPQLLFLQRFLQVTNEIEGTIRETEIFAYRLVRAWSKDGYDYAIVEETERSDEVIVLTTKPLTMKNYLIEEETAGRGDELFIHLGDSSDLDVPHIDDDEFWRLTQPSLESTERLNDDQVLLRRYRGPDPRPAAPNVGYLRTKGMFGQVQLLDRREDAIDLFAGHLFLQHALILPDSVYMDTRVDDLPAELPSVQHFDEAKRSALKAIWRTRPIFCLQGPPGTGKTTLVAQILQQIYEDDPSCQVLMTAQAHSAVDHLRDEVQQFVDRRREEDAAWIAPIAVRFRIPKPHEDPAQFRDAASLREVSTGLLGGIKRALAAREDPPDYIRDWLERAEEDGPDGDFGQLVRRSANFVYCTSTAQDLSELARSREMFDWSIIEEAGKAHGFDLVLPLETGHRWLLIGDQDQLAPYREQDFLAGLDRLSEICKGSFLNRFWDAMTPEERQGFVDDAKRWVRFFKQLFDRLRGRIVSELPLTDMLTEQHRMHPDIGDLISHAFYRDKIRNGTIDVASGLPMARVRHHLKEPPFLVGKAIVWVDVKRDLRFDESENGLHVNPAEVFAIQRLLDIMRPEKGAPRESLVVLTPYRRQVRELQTRLRQAPSWSTWPQGLEERRREGPAVYTVDSFQGRQASVVIVSMVRTRAERVATGKALGFLKEYERINVMMSRAEKFLVLVGDWDFFWSTLSDQSQEDGQPFAELAKLVNWLDRAFDEGRAVLIERDDDPEALR